MLNLTITTDLSAANVDIKGGLLRVHVDRFVKQFFISIYSYQDDVSIVNSSVFTDILSELSTEAFTVMLKG